MLIVIQIILMHGNVHPIGEAIDFCSTDLKIHFIIPDGSCMYVFLTLFWTNWNLFLVLSLINNFDKIIFDTFILRLFESREFTFLKKKLTFTTVIPSLKAESSILMAIDFLPSHLI